MIDKKQKAWVVNNLRSRRRRPILERLERREVLSVAGSPDLTFGSGSSPGYFVAANGFAPLGPTNASYGGTASAIQSNGEVVEVGTYYFSTHGSLSPIVTSYFAERFTTTGQVDSTTLQVNSLQASYQPGPGSMPVTSGATGVAIGSSGDIVVVGEVDGVAKVALLNPDGSLDTNFGTGGVVTLGTIGTGDSLLDYASAVAILPGGQFAVAGATSPTVENNTHVVEVLNAAGSVDTGYGTNGIAKVPLPAGASAFAPIATGLMLVNGGYESIQTKPLTLVEQADGSLVLSANVVTASGNAVTLTRLAATGSVDTTFGTGGQATISPSSVFPGATSFEGTALAIQPGGDLIVGGGVTLANSKLTQMAVERFTPAGVVDTSFGVGGVNVLPTPAILVNDPLSTAATSGTTVASIATRAGGQIMVADKSASDFTQLKADGSIDTSFGMAGQMVIFTQTPVIQNGPLPYSQNPSNLALGVASGSGAFALAFAPDGDTLATTSQGVYALLSQGSPNDYDGDGKTDPTVYVTSSGTFAFLPSNLVGGIPTAQFGIPGAGNSLPAPGAYGGEGVDEAAVYLPTLGEFAVLNIQTDLVVAVPFGVPGLGASLPAPGDYDLSAATELAVYIPSTSAYAIRGAINGSDVVYHIGTPNSGAIPVPADYFGTGRDDVAVYEPSTATFEILNLNNTFQVISIPFGIPGDSIPVPGDYDGSGKTELAVYIPSLAEFIYRPANGGPDVTEQFGIAGPGATLPAPGDYDGSGRTELAAYFPGSAEFVYRPAAGGNDVFSPQFGLANNTVPFVLASNIELSPTSSPQAIESPGGISPLVEIPLTPDVLDTLDGTVAKKKGDVNFSN